MDDKIFCFGLLVCRVNLSYGVCFHFLHLIFQEYLAALHLAKLSPDEWVNVFQVHLILSGGFCFGLHDSKMGIEHLS